MTVPGPKTPKVSIEKSEKLFSFENKTDFEDETTRNIRKFKCIYSNRITESRLLQFVIQVQSSRNGKEVCKTRHHLKVQCTSSMLHASFFRATAVRY